MKALRIGLAQINPTVGDFKGNTAKILEYIKQAEKWRVDLLTFPELALSGYPPEDLLLMPRFIQTNLDCLKKVISACKNMLVIVGFVDKKEDIYNAAALIYQRKLLGVYHKIYLPTYGVFDEDRYFQAGKEYLVFTFGSNRIALNICEDIWYPEGPSKIQSWLGGAEMILNISASPYQRGKRKVREKMLATRAIDNLAFIVYNNLVGGQDELVFDGGSMIFDPEGELLAQGKQFEEDLLVADLELEAALHLRLRDSRQRKERLSLFPEKDSLKILKIKPSLFLKDKPPLPPRKIEQLEDLEETYKALILGTADYLKKNGFKKVVIGLSGGIDSSLTAVIAVDALGKENVIGVSMPSPYSSREGLEDVTQLVGNLGIRLITLPITPIFKAYLKTLKQEFKGKKREITEENIQARIRGNLLMALSNKFGWLVLATGNKSELSVGYCTLYGDMAGGFAVIKDLPKTLVYSLASYRNSFSDKKVIPLRILKKEPSAELRPEQKDEDSLPSYSLLDPILQAYVEEDKDSREIVALGFEAKMVKEVIELVDKSEYKRRQSPPGIKITSRALGKDRRLPITNHYRNF